MIVDTMTTAEVFRELEADRDNVSGWWVHKREDMKKRALKCARFPMTVWWQYTSPRKNSYLVMAAAYGRKYLKQNGMCILALQHTPAGLTAYTQKLNWMHFMDRMVFTAHMWKRYRERINTYKTGIELMKQYFTNNGYGEETEGSQFVGRSVRYNGHDNICLSINDGVLLGERKDDAFIAKTFITYDMATGLQRQEFDAKREAVPTNEQLCAHCRKQIKNMTAW